MWRLFYGLSGVSLLHWNAMRRFWVVFVGLATFLGGCHPALAPSAVAVGQETSPVSLPPTVVAPNIAAREPTQAQPSPTLTPPPTSAPSPSSTPTPLACWSQPGRVDSGSLLSGRLKLPLEYAVYLPPCYDQQPQRRYPVLYLIHGMNYNHDQWDRLGADETANALAAAGEVNPFIIVMPRDRSWDEPGQDPFGEALLEELIPYVDQTYRTLPEREYRAIGGLSRGAGWAVHLGLSRWDLFGAIGGHSLPVFWSDTSRVRGWLAAIPTDSYPRIYLDIGEKDRPSILNSARWFENLLNEAGIPHEWYLNPGYHNEEYWSAHVEAYLRWYAQEW